MKPEDELKLYKEIVNNMAEGVYLISASDGKIVYTNPKFEQMFGYAPNEMIGQHVSIVNAPTSKDPQQTAKEIMDELAKNGIWSGEVLNIKKDKTTFWCSANVSTFDHPMYGQVLISVHKDISDLKEKLAELEEFKQLTEGREMKMVELKVRIKELEAQLAAKKN